MNTKEYQTYSSQNNQNICEPIADYCRVSRESMGSLFEDIVSDVTESDIRVVELFAGVGGFRIGLERASACFKTVWSNQWEPSTKKTRRINYLF